MAPDLIAGRYRVERVIGRGAMGTVWLCRDEVLGRDVAVKQMGLLAHESEPDRERALREARAAAALNHPSVVPVFDVVDDGTAPWLVMEYVPSRTLAEIIEEDGALSPDRLAHIGAQVASGLAAAHELGIIHRDVKPANVLVTEDDRAKVSDFGIARNLSDDRLTATGLVAGTPAYFSPELARGGDPSPKSDVWALGVLLYTAVEGDLPYPRKGNALAQLQVIVSDQPPEPQHAGPLAEPIRRMMDPDPRTRWEMRDAQHALKRLTDSPREWPAAGLAETASIPAAASPAASGPTDADPTGQETAPWGSATPDRSRRGPILALVALALLLVLGTTGYLLTTAPDDEQTPAAPSPSAEASAEPSPTEESSPSEPPSDTQSPEPSPTPGREQTPPGQAQVAAVESYFQTLPGDTDAGWARLAPSMQQEVGRDDYESWWGSIESVQTEGTTPVRGEPAVTTRITYSFKDGRVAVEEQRILLERAGGDYLIADDQVLSSRTVSD